MAIERYDLTACIGFPIVPMSATHGIDANHFRSAAPDLFSVEDRLSKAGEYASTATHLAGQP
jgi:hypothetical protein